MVWELKLLEDHPNVMALAADYVAIYMIEPETDRAYVVKLNRDIADKIVAATESFSYSQMFQAYANSRICEEDRESFLNVVMPERLIQTFADGREKFELNYRILADDKQKHYSGLFIRVSNTGEALKIIAGFRNIDDVLNIQKQTRTAGLYSAYTAISGAYLAMHRINVKKNTYSNIKTTDAILRYTLPDSNSFDENVHNIIKELAREESYESALAFLNVETMDERMRNKNHLTTQFEGRIAGMCRLHLFKENADEEGRLEHVIFAVEVVDNDKYQSVFDVLARGFQNIFWVDLANDTAKILKLDGYVTKGMDKDDRSFFPYSLLLNQYIADRVHPEDKKLLHDKINIETLREVFAKQDECIGNYRVQINGETHYYQYSISRVRGADYIVAGFQNIDATIEEHLEAERKQRELEEAHLQGMREHAEVISSLSTIYSTIFRADVDTHNYDVLTSVDLMDAVAGSSGNFDDVKERIIFAFMAPEMREPMREFLDLDTLAERLGSSNTISAEYKDPAGRWFQSRFIVKRRDESGTVKEVLYVARDFTDEKEKALEQQEQLSQALAVAQQANKAKTTFLNSMSHDIRTPMNAIIGFTALAQTHIDEQEQVQDYLTKISTSSTHLLSLINDILDMSRIESGTVKLDAKPVHIPDLLHDLRTMILSLVNAKNLNLYIDTQDVTHEDVITDKLRLNQVLINIVGNAIKFTQPGGDIIIRLLEKPSRIKNHTTYEFSVKDNGIGMSEEFLEHIFDTFSREYSSTVSGIQGTGLGMAITKNIIDMMGGDIKVESKEGKGSKFTVTLDLRLANEPVKNEPIPALHGARALVVDDDINTCRSVSKMLRDIKMRPDWTTSGKEAIIRAQDAEETKDEYKVYIIDYLMPDMNGIETVRRIRKVISEDAAIIVLTAYDWTEFEHEAREAGVTAFVSKPIFMSELREVLTQPVKQETPKQEEKQNKQYSYQGKRVLLVEDNDLNREIATAILEETGISVDGVNDGDIAVATINEAPAEKYDLILMDIQMPKMDGYTATREIRTLADNRKANIPIVAMTANAFEEDKQKAFASGMNGHIIKPINIAEIAKVLDEVFAEKL